MTLNIIVNTIHRHIAPRRLLLIGLACLLIGGLILAGGAAQAQPPSPDAPAVPSFHPDFALLDINGENVRDSGQPASTMQTCGACHDTAFIARHSGHASAGYDALKTPGGTPHGRSWEQGAGWFGGWDAVIYRTLSADGDPVIDLTTAEWIQTYGIWHVGGGPAEFRPDGIRLDALPADDATLAARIYDAATDTLAAWDWASSGVVEMNCFLCHTPAPDNAARIAALQAGAFAWANSAVLASAGIITADADGYRWQPDAFNTNGTVRAEQIQVQDPTNDNCGLCHGQTQSDAQVPGGVALGDPAQRMTLITGQYYSPQRLANSGANLANKNTLRRSWDVHAERALECTDCHYALNNPIYYSESAASRPDHLEFDPRRMDFGEYLQRPLHQFANANAATSFSSTDRDCATCHDAAATHTWLPYTQRHITALACETCHVPTLYAPALETLDWTALTPDGSAHMTYRGLDETGQLITGFTPVLLPDDQARLAPYNLLTAFYWVYGDPARPVPLRDLQAAWLEGDTYAADIIIAFDTNRDGTLDSAESQLDHEDKIALIAGRLSARGLDAPRIVGEVEAFPIHHNVTQGAWATRDCATCHSENSRLNAPFTLTSSLPSGVQPHLISGDGLLNGRLVTSEDGTLRYVPATDSAPTHLYILGHDSVALVDLAGVVIFLAVLGGVGLHAGLRYAAARRFVGQHVPEVRQVYMYTLYERQWHWLQTIAIIGLLFTGLVIHKPDQFRMFSFQWVVLVHNALALILFINAALAAFYHLVSGEIRQFLPRPYGFFDQAITQAKYYLGGIFRHEPHPFEKTPQRKLNPLQQITYLAILNVLLPAQILTGVLMWGAQQWPDVTTQLGGLGFLGPLHTLIAWLFATFIVMHVYLTTTGHTPLANIKAMMLGWDDVEVHEPSPATAPE